MIVAFALFFMEFMIRYARRSPIRREVEAPTPGSDGTLNGHKGFTRGILTRKISIMLGAVSFVTLMLFIRSVLLLGKRSRKGTDYDRAQSNLPNDRTR